MTPREMREFEQGKAYGYSHPNAGQKLFTHSPLWNKGLLEGQAQARADRKMKEKQEAEKVYARRMANLRYYGRRDKERRDLDKKMVRIYQGYPE